MSAGSAVERPGLAARVYEGGRSLPAASLRDLARRNAAVLISARESGFSPFTELDRANSEFPPLSSSKTEPDTPAPRVLFIGRIDQESRYFLARPHPDLKFDEEVLGRILRIQASVAGDHLTKQSYAKVRMLSGLALPAEICGVLFTEFFSGEPQSLTPGAQPIHQEFSPSDWEIASHFLDPYNKMRDKAVPPEVFTFRSIFEPVYQAHPFFQRWPMVSRTAHINALGNAEKGRLAEDLFGNTLESLLGEVDNRHLRLVAQKLLNLHPYDPTHERQFVDRVNYYVNLDPLYALGLQYLLAGDLAGKLIPDPNMPVYLPNYGAQRDGSRGSILVPDAWINDTLNTDPINALGELMYVASLARDDTNGRLRGAQVAYIPGRVSGPGLLFNDFDNASERALVHTALLLNEVYKRDGEAHSIYPSLRGISDKARRRFGSYTNLAGHPLLYDDPQPKRLKNQGPDSGKGPDDSKSLVPGGRPPTLSAS